MARYFHAAPIPLGEGSIILPGNFGRLFAYRGLAHPHIDREHIIECVRAAHYPDKPSRLESIFLLTSIIEARAYHREHAAASIIYEVDADTDRAPWHLGTHDMSAIGAAPAATCSSLAHAYWSEVPRTKIEVVYEGPVRVVRRVFSNAAAEQPIEQ